MRRLILLFLVPALIALALVACDGGDEDDATPSLPPPSQTPVPPRPTVPPTWTPASISQTDITTDTTDQRPKARLRVVHASPDLPTVKFYLDGRDVGGSFSLGQYNVVPYMIYAEDYSLQVLPTGANPDETPPLLEYPLAPEANQSVVALLVGTADDLQIVLYEETLDPLPVDTARVSVIHAVPRGAAFNFEEAGQVLRRELNFGAIGGPLEMEAGSHTFDFTSGPIALNPLNLYLTPNYAYTLLLIGDASSNDYRVIHFDNRVNRETQVRVIHASPDMPRVDVYLDDLLAGCLTYQDWEDWTAYPSTSYQLRVVPAGDSEADPIYQGSVTLNANRAVNLVLLDSVEHLGLVQSEEEWSQTPANGARFTFINAAAGTTQVDIETLGGAIPGLAPVSFGTASRPMLYTAGEETFFFQTTDGAEPRQVDVLSARDWPAGYAYTIVITGHPDTEPLVFKTEVGVDSTVMGGEGLIVREEGSEDAGLAAETFEMRLIHALPDTGAVDLEIDGVPIFEDVQPRTSTPYDILSTDSSVMVVRSSATGDKLLREDITWTGAPKLTLFVFKDETRIRYELATDERFEIPGGQARLRVLHAAPAKPTLQLTRQILPTATPAPSPEEEVTPLPPEEEALSEVAQFGFPTEPMVIPAGTYDVRILENETAILVLMVEDATFEPGVFYDMIILPDASGLSVDPVLIPYFP
jgi:hypothetical protein